MNHFEQLVYAIGWLTIASCVLILFLVVFHKVRDAWIERRDYYDLCKKIARLRTRAQENHPEIVEACDYILNKGFYDDKCWDAVMFIHAIEKDKEKKEEHEMRARNA